jgi:uncharacterized protein YcaQ
VRISREVARRFLLGRQGLWPGRRWKGLRGTEAAMRAMGNVQLDPLRVVARAQDLALASRVLDYREEDWARLTYEKRRFFEWGGWLAVRPMDELPYYRTLMRRSRTFGWGAWAASEHGAVIEEMRSVLAERAEVANRDFAAQVRKRAGSYWGRKDSAVGLHYLWRTGEAMVARRTPTFERVYARTDAVLPAGLPAEAPEAEADDFLLLKAVRAAGFLRPRQTNRSLLRDVSRREIADWIARRLADGALIELEVDGLTGPHVALADSAADLETLAAGRVPRGWKPRESTTDDEVSFLSPLDPVIHDRDRTRALFDFDYKWGVYDKVEKRKYGYYDLPILWRDRLVGRMDAKVDRPTMTLIINGLWLEDQGLGEVDAFAAAFGRGIDRLRAFLGTSGLDARAVARGRIRTELEARSTAHGEKSSPTALPRATRAP